MIDLQNGIKFLESSFLSPLFKKTSVTDISYNGDSIYYEDTQTGRNKSEIAVNEEMVRDLLRQLANITEKQFSFSEPVFCASLGKYRITALHHSICKRKGVGVYNFSIRIGSEFLRIAKDDSFMPQAVKELIQVILNNKLSIIIGGITGSGKTELQKYIISLIKPSGRLIVIDNILELDYIKEFSHLDINVWQTNPKNILASNKELISTALRCNPDWLIIAESRGKEASEVLMSAVTGHPIITTLHAYDSTSIPSRIISMIRSGDPTIETDYLFKEISYHFHFYFYTKKEKQNNGNIRRYVSEVLVINDHGENTKIFQYRNNKISYTYIPTEILKILENYSDFSEFCRVFVKK